MDPLVAEIPPAAPVAEMPRRLYLLAKNVAIYCQCQPFGESHTDEAREYEKVPFGEIAMALTDQQVEMQERRAKEEERRVRDAEWRETTRSEDVNWRVTVRSEDLAWRQGTRAEDLEYRARESEWRAASREGDVAHRQRESDWRAQVRAEDSAWRQTQLRIQADEAERANRRFALLAAAQSLKPGSEQRDLLKLAAHYVAWIESKDTDAK
jgi:hypothetical protein